MCPMVAALACLAATAPARAVEGSQGVGGEERPPAVQAAPAAAPEEGHFLGDRYRWANMNVLARSFYDVIAIPANVGSWDGGDWLRLAFWSAAVAVPWAAGNPSLDVQVTRWAHDSVNPVVPTVWTGAMQPALWGTLAVGLVGTWAWAASSGNDDVAQGISLMGEALAVTQVYHVTLKLLIGRDGPADGNGMGEVKGPVNAFKVYPAGTPSGHAATLFVLASSGFAYFRPPAWVQVLGYATVGSLVAFHVIDRRHFLSESIWGSALGWHVGQWVVRHRASWLYGERPAEPRFTIAPTWVAGAPGLAISGRF